jgi:hypothetical protein
MILANAFSTRLRFFFLHIWQNPNPPPNFVLRSALFHLSVEFVHRKSKIPLLLSLLEYNIVILPRRAHLNFLHFRFPAALAPNLSHERFGTHVLLYLLKLSFSFFDGDVDRCHYFIHCVITIFSVVILSSQLRFYFQKKLSLTYTVILLCTSRVLRLFTSLLKNKLFLPQNPYNPKYQKRPFSFFNTVHQLHRFPSHWVTKHEWQLLRMLVPKAPLHTVSLYQLSIFWDLYDFGDDSFVLLSSLRGLHRLLLLFFYQGKLAYSRSFILHSSTFIA